MRSIFLAIAAASLLPAQSQQLFNGKDLSGWTMVGPGRFVVADGMLKTEGGMGLLYYNGRKLANETLRIVFKTATPKANSGVFIRLPEKPLDPWYGVHNGYEVQIDAGGDEWHSTGAIYSLSKANKQLQKAAGEWNTMDIQMEGSLTRISVNGEVVNEFKGGQTVPERKQWFEPIRGPRPTSGYIGLQNHDADSTIYFKEISVVGKGTPISRGERDRILSYYHSTRKQVVDTVAGLSTEQFNYKPGSDRWSVREVVEHLTLTEPGIFGMALAGLSTPVPAPSEAGMTDEQFLARVRDRSQKVEAPAPFRPAGQWNSSEALVAEFKARRDQNLEYLRETQQDLSRTYFTSPLGTMSVYRIMMMVPAHTERHLEQIKEVMKSEGFPKK